MLMKFLLLAGDEADNEDTSDNVLERCDENGKRIFLCKICSQPSVRRATIRRHLETVHATIEFEQTCQFCNRKFKNKYTLREHQRANNPCRDQLLKAVESKPDVNEVDLDDILAG